MRESKKENWEKNEGKKRISKNNITELDLHNINIKKYVTDKLESGKISEKQYRITDWVGLVKEIVKNIENDEFSLCTLLKFQIDILGYIKYINPDLTTRHIAILELDTTYSPKFKAYCLKNGQVCEMKIHKTIPRNDKKVKSCFKDTPVENGDIIYMEKCNKEPRRKKNPDGSWGIVEGEFNWWINQYKKIQL